MWQIKTFKTLAAQTAWIKKHESRYQIVILFIDNGYGVDYRKLRVIY
jgi:hypothetical protein